MLPSLALTGYRFLTMIVSFWSFRVALAVDGSISVFKSCVRKISRWVKPCAFASASLERLRFLRTNRNARRRQANLDVIRRVVGDRRIQREPASHSRTSIPRCKTSFSAWIQCHNRSRPGRRILDKCHKRVLKRAAGPILKCRVLIFAENLRSLGLPLRADLGLAIKHLALNLGGRTVRVRPGCGRAGERKPIHQRTGRFLQPVKMQRPSQTIQRNV